MNAALGTAGISLGLGASLVGAITVVLALVRRRPHLLRSVPLFVGLIGLGGVLAVFAMERALITRDFRLAYIVQVGSHATPALFNVAAMWAALEGSILLWALILAGYTALVAWHFRDRRTDPLLGWSTATLFVVNGFFYLMMSGPANPFALTKGPIPTDGAGPNPLLQNHVLMAFHPPMVYLGLVGFSVPFAFAIGALVTGRVGEGWLVETRRWTLFAWGFLTLGIVLGGWWSYEVLGWGGYWGWDPVENASFLPWLTGTAFLHSVMVQERRGMLRVWNLSLVCATFALTILGTFLTRSGVTESVHAFSNSDIGTYLLVFFGLVTAGSIALIGWRGDRLRSPGSIDSPVSREGAFLFNNVLFAAFAFVVLLGTVFPLFVEAVNGDKLTVGPPFFNRMSVPIGLTLLFLMAVAPALPWRKASGSVLSERLLWPAWAGAAGMVLALVLGGRGLAPLAAFGLGGFAAGAAVRQLVLASRRNGWRGLVGRANGGMVVHLGVVVVAVAVAASGSYSHTYERSLKPGETQRVGSHEITYVRLEQHKDKVKDTTKALVRIDGGSTYAPAVQRYLTRGMVTGVPSVRSSITGDVYLKLEKEPTSADAAISLTVRVIPLTVWLWIGGLLMGLGTVLAAFPGRRRRPLDPVSQPSAREELVGAGR